MAITCVPTITIMNIAEKKVKVECLITVDAGHIYSVVVQEADISTSAKKAEVANIIWAKLLVLHQKRLLEDGVATEIENLENILKKNIEGRAV